MREYAGELRPYVHVRFGINALIQRQGFLSSRELWNTGRKMIKAKPFCS